MADIAAEVGLTRPAMHYYFRTKELLFQAIFGDILMSFLTAVWFSWRILKMADFLSIFAYNTTFATLLHCVPVVL